MSLPIFLRRFVRDERAAIIIWFALTLPVVLGIFALSFDLARLTSMNTELQDMADAAALAAANALDGTEDAIVKANAAAARVINNSKFADSGVSILDLVYAQNYEDLVSGPYLSEGSGSDAKKAYWVQAISNTGRMSTSFIRVVGGEEALSTTARATAGSHTVACAVQPLFMCLPNGGTTLNPGQMIRVKEQPGNTWGPGNFGLLDPPYSSVNGNQKNTLIKKNLAQSSPDVCYVNALTPAQGSKSGPVKEGLNARFDIFDNNPDNVVKIPPGPNNYKGLPYQKATDACVKSATPEPATIDGRMPRDSCFPDGCGGPYGNGVWSGQKYWEYHHGVGTYPTGGFSTRFAMYMAEMGLDTEGNSTGVVPPKSATDPEANKMGPVCAADKKITGTGTWERRVIYAAMIDCTANADWLVGNSTKSPIRDADIGQFFLTEPTENGQEIYLEFVKRITKGDDEGKLQALIQLYPNPQNAN